MGKLSFGAQLFVFVVLGGALYIVFYIWFYGPMQQEIVEKTTKRRTLQAEVENAKTTAARLPEFRREVERKEATLQALSRILPSRKEVDDLLRTRPASKASAAGGSRVSRSSSPPSLRTTLPDRSKRST